MRTIVLSTLMLLSEVIAQPQSLKYEADAAMYNAYLGHKDVNFTKALWKKVVADKKANHQASTKDMNALYALSLSQLGLLSATLRDRDEDLFDDYVDETEENLLTLIDKNENWGEPRALLSALYGLKIAYSPMKGMLLGSKSQRLMDQALKDAPASPLVWKLYGNSKFFTPETWGGDIEEAIKAYKKSLQLYEGSSLIKSNWFYLDTIAFLGQAYHKNNQTQKAIETYEKALEVEPDFLWVNSNLIQAARRANTTK